LIARNHCRPFRFCAGGFYRLRRTSADRKRARWILGASLSECRRLAPLSRTARSRRIGAAGWSGGQDRQQDRKTIVQWRASPLAKCLGRGGRCSANSLCGLRTTTLVDLRGERPGPARARPVLSRTWIRRSPLNAPQTRLRVVLASSFASTIRTAHAAREICGSLRVLAPASRPSVVRPTLGPCVVRRRRDRE
jgi:hypothetical protein